MDFNEFTICLQPSAPIKATLTLGGSRPQHHDTHISPDPYPIEAMMEQASALERAIPLAMERGAICPRGIHDFGRSLYETLFQGEVLEGFRRAVSLSRNINRAMRLRISAPAEWHVLPFEFLIRSDESPEQFLGLNRSFTIVRTFAGAQERAWGAMSLPLRVLVVICSPFDRQPLNTRKEIDLLLGALSGLISEGVIAVDFVAGHNTMQRVVSRLVTQPCHILHWIGHGESDAGNVGMVVEDESGHARVVGQMSLWNQLQAAHLPRLVILNICKGAFSNSRPPFASLADVFLQAGAPAVLAHQTEFADDMAAEAARLVYGAIARGAPVDEALIETRAGLTDGISWHTPVLFLNYANGELFLASPTTRPRQDSSYFANCAAQAHREHRWQEAACYAQTACLVTPTDVASDILQSEARVQEELDGYLRNARYAYESGFHQDALENYDSYRSSGSCQSRATEERTRVELLRHAVAGHTGEADPLLRRETEMAFGLPYATLARYGIHPGLGGPKVRSTLAPPYPAEFEAWRRLCNPCSRLAADFYLYRVQEPQEWAKAVLRIMDGENLPEITLRRELGQDGSLMLLFSGQRESARRLFEARLRTEPADTRTAHRLALFCHAEACSLESSSRPAEAEACWRDVIAFWCRTLADDSYWSQWVAERQLVYGPSQEDSVAAESLGEVRQDLYAQLGEHFRRRANQCLRDGESARAAAYVELEILAEVEWKGVMATRAALAVSRAEAPFGPLLLKKLNFESRFSAMMRTCQNEMAQYEQLGIVEALARAAPAICADDTRVLRLFFSRLAKPAALIEIGQPETALEALLQIDSRVHAGQDLSHGALADGEAWFQRDAGELRVRAHLACAARHTLPAGIEDVRSCWNAALAHARHAGIEEYAALQIAHFAMNQATAFRQLPSPDVEDVGGLSQAIALLELAFGVLHDSSPPELSRELADALLCRGMRLEKFDRHESSYRDLRSAWMLYPDDPAILKQMCITLVYWARDLRAEGQWQKARDRVEEGLKRLRDLTGCLEDADTKKTEHELEFEFAILHGEDPAAEAFRALDAILAGAPDIREPNGTAHLDRASERTGAEDWAGAAAALEEVLPCALKNPVLWKETSVAIRMLFEAGGAAEAAALVEHAARTGDNHPGLMTLANELLLATRLLNEEKEVD